MLDPALRKQLVRWEVISALWINLVGGFMHSLYRMTGSWAPIAQLAPVKESIWEHMKMFFWPGLLFAIIQYVFVGKRVPHYWFGKLAGLIVTPIVAATSFIAYLAIERASGDFSPSDIFSISSSMVSVCVGQAVCYWVMPTDALPKGVIRFTSLGYLLLMLAFSSFTYFPPKLYLFEQNHHYVPIGEYGIEADSHEGEQPGVDSD